MALIVLQHSTVDNFDVDPTFTVTSTNRILAGSLVGLNSSTYLSLPSTTVSPLGIAGDSLSDEYRTTAYSTDLVISPTGKKRYTSNRVSDMFNDTLASGKMTVYFGSGKFATDQYLLGDTFTPGRKVYATAAGLFASTAGSLELARPVGYIANAPGEYPSGVPGVDSPTVQLSMSLGKFLIVHLNIGG